MSNANIPGVSEIESSLRTVWNAFIRRHQEKEGKLRGNRSFDNTKDKLSQWKFLSCRSGGQAAQKSDEAVKLDKILTQV